MISILIPAYNYNISKLITQIHQQLSSNLTPFEIIIFEDGSNQFINNNNNLKNTTVIVNKENIGRVKARQKLASLANYNWLLFLDADVLLTLDTFIIKYLKSIKQDYDVVFGGFAYYKSPPNEEYLLRWKYGKTKEQIPAIKRNKKPYKVIISANFMIKKTVFSNINKHIEDNKSYGFDNYFGALLQQNKVKVLHIDNPVYHIGIEKNDIYLKKKELAASTLLFFYNSKYFNNNNSNDLLKIFTKLKRIKLVWFFSLLYRFFGSKMKQKLTSNKPTISLLQFYRICFMCNLAFKQNS